MMFSLTGRALSIWAIAVAVVCKVLFLNDNPSNPIISIQAKYQALLKPAQWIPIIRDFHRHEMQIGTYHVKEDNDESTLLADIKSMLESNDLLPQSVENATDAYIIQSFYFTPTAAWLDTVTLTLRMDRKQHTMSVYGEGESTGFLPVSIPMAPLINIVCCWFPFLDVGNNERYLQAIQQSMNTKYESI
mmetsp:Transcript_41910/g.68995  ORF Transcript_41910/g.68995 Transcript_41910/m.68995 type:complete len:189 (-) Transcript_41910:223-789(-)